MCDDVFVRCVVDVLSELGYRVSTVHVVGHCLALAAHVEFDDAGIDQPQDD